MDGILNINKPAGITSYRAVAAVKRLSGEKRVGHAGTLDPDATGVLPVCLGRGTRVIEFLMNTAKTYRAVIELGVATDTYDASGNVTARADATGVTRDAVETALGGFRGKIQQTPPMYSALKHQGKPLYELARAGISIERQSRPVTIHRLELAGWEPPALTLEVECSKGTYIRSLAHDLGHILGCGAHLAALERTQCGIFGIGDAAGLEKVEKAFQSGNAESLLYPIDSVLQDMESIEVNAAEESAISMGQTLDREPDDSGGRYRRAYAPNGRFVAILHRDKETGVWRPKKVFV